MEKEEKKEKGDKRQSRVQSREDSRYPEKELKGNAQALFGTRPECVAAALRSAGKKEASVEEARESINVFLRRGIK